MNNGTTSSNFRPRLPILNNQEYSDKIMCANCGGSGHIYRVCNYPICSFGVICCRITLDAAGGNLIPEYLMVQRKDSLCYVEFIRAKWSPQNRQYLMKLFSSMTPVERKRIADAKSFDELWFGFWHNDACRSYMKEYHQAKSQFNTLKQGFPLRCAHNNMVITFSLAYLLQNTVALYDSTEWGWPKGRRNINETDLVCALREFNEETGVPLPNISILMHAKPFEEVFSGCNHVRYRHVYFLAVHHNPTPSEEDLMANMTPAQAQEIGSVRWCTYSQVLANIRDINVERRELFRRVHALVQTNLNNLVHITEGGQDVEVGAEDDVT